MQVKKYYTISEVSTMLKVEQHNLRALDKKLGKKLVKIKNRRYYTKDNIEQAKSLLNIQEVVVQHVARPAIQPMQQAAQVVQLTLPFAKDMAEVYPDKPKKKSITKRAVVDQVLLQRIDRLITDFHNVKTVLLRARA